MTDSKNINRICVIVTVLAVLVTFLFMNGTALGVIAYDSVTFDYEDTLFDDSYVHTIDLKVDDWEAFLKNATSEEYVNADVTIDGETIKNVGLRAKGNTSLTTVSQLDSDRYSLKIEFDAYDSSLNYKGLDKLCLNNLIQDYTMMKDYVTYKLMYEFGVPSPLVSYVYITVNGEDWGLYLAVEGVEESFLERNYGKNYGDLYKPDSMSMGGGRGNGGEFDGNMPDFKGREMPENFDGEMPDFDARKMPGNFDGEMPDFDARETPDESEVFGRGSNDTKLKYTDDDADSYSSIFESAKTDVTKADQKRLIEALKNLSEGTEDGNSEKIEDAVNIEEVMRYMVVHNFVVNEDSYTGSMVHNYYLYEENGLLSMIPWDYNLAFGTFKGQDATASVNDAIDTPLSISENDTDRPMFSWITSTEEYTELYHGYYEEFIEKFYSNGYLDKLIDTTYEMIKDYVDKDPTKFCTTEEFDKAVTTLKKFVNLRFESIKAQVNGTIASSDEDRYDSSELIDASDITVSDMGTMDGDFGREGGFKMPDRNDFDGKEKKRP